MTSRNKGYGFVRFSTHSEAVAAKAGLHEQPIVGRKVRVGWAMKNCSLLVREVDATLTNEQLAAVRQR